MQAIRRILGREHHASCQDQVCKEERLREADQRLHEQAQRLHVLEWEAYGHAKRTPKDAH